MALCGSNDRSKGGSRIELADLSADFAPEGVPYAVLLPPGYDERGPYPLCLFLHGGGGSRQNLVDLQPFFDGLWAAGLMPPTVIASASTGAMSFYLDHPDGKYRWESFIAKDLLEHLRSSYNVGRDRRSTVIAGISMGGYGSLKIAFQHPDQFGAVAAVQPMIEPGLRAADIGARNRFFNPPGGPDDLIGEHRDPALFEANNPASRARANAAAIRESRLAIYLEVGDEDMLNAHDGAEFLHRVLWDFDVSHEYHLVRGADHGGPTFIPRLREAFAWLGSTISASEPHDAPKTDAEEQAVRDWIQRGLAGEPVKVDPTSTAFIVALRAQLEPARERAAQVDPTTRRRYGILPKTN